MKLIKFNLNNGPRYVFTFGSFVNVRFHPDLEKYLSWAGLELDDFISLRSCSDVFNKALKEGVVLLEGDKKDFTQEKLKEIMPGFL